ncbi:MAG: hemerythrin domain-containing protein [Burkholderiaceae bacterium]
MATASTKASAGSATTTKAKGKTTKGKSKNKTTKASKTEDATAMLRADHKRVSELFGNYEKARSTSRKRELVATICTELTVHAQLEEEIFYPAVKKALKDKELVPEATVEHATLKDLIAQVKGVEPDGEMFDAKIKVLSEYVKHHVKEEQGEMFAKAKKTKLDMNALGAQMATRKKELMQSGTV